MTTITQIDVSDPVVWEKLLEVAGRMPTKHTPSRRLDTFIVAKKETGEVLGYCQVAPVVISAWIRPGRDTIQAVAASTKFFAKACGGELLTTVDTRGKFYKHMGRLGFTPTGNELFYTADPQ